MGGFFSLFVVRVHVDFHLHRILPPNFPFDLCRPYMIIIIIIIIIVIVVVVVHAGTVWGFIVNAKKKRGSRFNCELTFFFKISLSLKRTSIYKYDFFSFSRPWFWIGRTSSISA